MNDTTRPTDLTDDIFQLVVTAVEDRDEQLEEHHIESEGRGCSCHISPPCSYCVSKPQEFDEFKHDVEVKIAKLIAKHTRSDELRAPDGSRVRVDANDFDDTNGHLAQVVESRG